MKSDAKKRKNVITPGLISFMVEKGILSKENLGINKNDLDRIYTNGKQLYEAGKYKDAQQLFSFLYLLEKKNPSFLYGLGSTALMLNELDSAISAFGEYASLVSGDPRPYYYIATCYEKKKDIISVLISLKTTANIAADQKPYQEMKQRALLAIEYYTKLLIERNEAKKEKKKEAA